MNQLNYRLSHPVAALQTSFTKDMDKYSRIRFDYASFDAQVFGKQPLMGTNQDQEMSHFPDCKFHIFYLMEIVFVNIGIFLLRDLGMDQPQNYY